MPFIDVCKSHNDISGSTGPNLNSSTMEQDWIKSRGSLDLPQFSVSMSEGVKGVFYLQLLRRLHAKI